MAKSDVVESTAEMGENVKDVAFDVVQFGGGAVGGYLLTDVLQNTSNSFLQKYAPYLIVGGSLLGAIVLKNKVAREVLTGIGVGSTVTVIQNKAQTAWAAKSNGNSANNPLNQKMLPISNDVYGGL